MLDREAEEASDLFGARGSQAAGLSVVDERKSEEDSRKLEGSCEESDNEAGSSGKVIKIDTTEKQEKKPFTAPKMSRQEMF